MPKIFISYRREDSEDIAGRIYDRLEAHYSAPNVVIDVDAVPLGVDFRKFLGKLVGQCDVLLAIIGRKWLTATDEQGRRRLTDPKDFLRIEIESAKAQGIPVIPVLVRRATIPADTELPQSLAFLPFINGATVSSGKDFSQHMQRLIKGIDGLTEATAEGGEDDAGKDPGEHLLAAVKAETQKLLPSAGWSTRRGWWFLGSDRGFHLLKAKPTRNTLRVRIRKNPSRKSRPRSTSNGWILEADSPPTFIRDVSQLPSALKLFKSEWL